MQVPWLGLDSLSILLCLSLGLSHQFSRLCIRDSRWRPGDGGAMLSIQPSMTCVGSFSALVSLRTASLGFRIPKLVSVRGVLAPDRNHVSLPLRISLLLLF